jgi:hemerythrin-like domain-containing protein
MCEFCGCRENPEIGALGAEHDAIVALADEVMAAVGQGTMTIPEGVEKLSRLLTPHVAREESGVFRVAERMGLGSQYVDDLEEDHARYGAALGDPTDLDSAMLESLLDDLYRHIAVEEYDLFPVVARELERSRPARAEGPQLVSSPLGRSAPGSPQR